MGSEHRLAHVPGPDLRLIGRDFRSLDIAEQLSDKLNFKRKGAHGHVCKRPWWYKIVFCFERPNLQSPRLKEAHSRRWLQSNKKPIFRWQVTSLPSSPDSKFYFDNTRKGISQLPYKTTQSSNIWNAFQSLWRLEMCVQCKSSPFNASLYLWTSCPRVLKQNAFWFVANFDF